MISHGLPVYVGLEPVDMRIGAERLGALVRSGCEPSLSRQVHGGPCAAACQRFASAAPRAREDSTTLPASSPPRRPSTWG